MRILLLDTSGPVGQVGLADGERLVERRLDAAQKHARDLVPTLKAMLDEQGWRSVQLDAVFVSLGPGSYTGLRVGVMSAKTLAYATGCKLIGVPTFEILAHAALAHAPQVEVIEDAQQGRVYTQRFPVSRDAARSGLTILDHEAWLAQLDPAFTLTGPGLKKKHDTLPSHQPLLPSEFWAPSLASLLHLGQRRLEENRTDDPMTLEPLYARATSAELQWTALGR